jgi:hypothetical protein
VAQVVRQGPRRRFIHLRRAAQLSARLCSTALRFLQKDMDLASVNEELAEIDGQIGDILRALQ